MRLFFLFFLCLYYSVSSAQSNVESINIYKYYQQGNYEKVYELTEKEIFNNYTYFNIYISAVFRLKKFNEAEKTLKKLLKSNPNHVNFSIALGRIYQELGEVNSSKKLYLQIVDKLTADGSYIQNVSRVFCDYEVYDYAIESLLKGRQILNKPSLFNDDLISIYSLKKDKKMLINEYLIALENGTKTIEQAKNTFEVVFTDIADYDELQSNLIKIIQKQPEKEIYTDLLIWQYLQKEAYETALKQLIAQDKRTNGNGEKIFKNAPLFNKNTIVQIKAYEYLISKGQDNPCYLAAKIEFVNLNYHFYTTENYTESEFINLSNQYSEIINQYGINSKTLPAFKKWVQLEAYYLKKTTQIIEKIHAILNSKLLNYSEIGEMKLALADIYILNNEPWEAFLTYQQIAKDYTNKDLGNEATFRSAKLSYFQGDFTYAKTQIDVLKSATSQLISNDALNLSLMINDNLETKTDSLSLHQFAQAELLEFKKNYKQTFDKLDSINISYPNNKLKDAILILKSRINLKKNVVEEAIKNLNEIILSFPESIWIDDAIFNLAEIYEKKLKNIEEAQKYYQKLITEHSTSLYASEARNRFRNLRGS